MRKSIKKLSLHRETVVRLDPASLEQAAGGQTLTCLDRTTCCPAPSQFCGSVRCSQLSQCASFCIPCQTATECIG